MITFKDFFSFKKNRFFWLNLIAMVIFLVAVCMGALRWLDGYTHHGESYVVPNVKDITLNEAESMLQRKHMKGLVVDSTYVKGARNGIIYEQRPVGGCRVKEGRTIYLTITTTKVPTVKLPDLIDNSSVRQASAKLISMGFKLNEPEKVPGEQDWIYGIKYNGKDLATGDKVPHEAFLTLCVGSMAMKDSLAMANDSLMVEGIPQSDNENDEEIKIDSSWF